MAIKINNTTVINDSRGLENITNLKTIGGQSILGTGDIPLTGGGGTADLSNVNQDIIPALSEVYDIGSTDKRWFDVNVSNSININGSSLIAANDVISTTSDLSTNSLLAGDVLISDNLITPDNSTAQQYLGEKGVLIVNGNLEIDGEWAALPNVKTGTAYTAADSGLLDTNFVHSIASDVYKIAAQPDSKILVSARYDFTYGQIVRLNSDGSIDNSFTMGRVYNSYDNIIVVQSNGKIVVGGGFYTYNGTTVNRITRLNPDGSIDTSFNTGTGFDYIVNAIEIQSDGKIVVGGGFYTYNGYTANRIARLNADGSIDTSFNTGTGFNSSVYKMAIQSDGKIVAGGLFTSYNGYTANRIARLNPDGSIDTSFNTGTGFDAYVYKIAIQSDGKIVVGGSFTSYNGYTANRIVRLNTNGSIDTSFNIGTGFNSSVNTIAIQQDGKIVVGGSFTSYNGYTASYIVRLNPDGSIDTSFNTGTGFNSSVNTIALENEDTGVLIGGYFTSYNQQYAVFMTRIKSGYSMAYPLVTGKEGFIRYNQDIKSIQAYNGSRWELLERVITPPTKLSTSGTVNIDFSGAPLSIQGNLTGNINYIASNYTEGSTITILVKNGFSSRTVSFPYNWVFVGEKPTAIAGGKKAILTVTSFGTTEEDCVAAWAVQQ